MDGSFSSADAAKVKKFQRKKHVTATGKVTRSTWKKSCRRPPRSEGLGEEQLVVEGLVVKKGRIALAFAKAQLGERYRFAGAGPNVWDCSGLTMKAWAKAGVKLPAPRGQPAQGRQAGLPIEPAAR